MILNNVYLCINKFVMSLTTAERALLAQLVTRFNLIEQNAKKIDELPLKENLNGNDLLHISENGVSKRMNISNLLDAVQNRSYDHLVSVINMDLVGNDFSIESAAWEISSILYNSANSFTQNIPFCALGFLRKDIVIGDSLNEIIYIQGEENEGISFAPPLPPNTVLITELDVTDNSINASGPIIGDNFKQKLESGFIDFYSAGTVTSIAINSVQSHIRLYNATELQSLYFRPNANVYPGKQFVITNKRNVAIPIPHNASGVDVYTPFIFPDEADYYLDPNESITFYYDQNTLKFLSSNKPNRYKSVTTSGVIDSSYNGRIVYAKNTVSLTIPLGLKVSFVMLTKGNFIVTFSEGSGVSLFAPNGKKLPPNSMCSFTNDGVNSHVLVGGLEL